MIYEYFLSISVSKDEVEELMNIYYKLTCSERSARHNKLDRTKFRDVLYNCFGITDDMLLDRGIII